MLVGLLEEFVTLWVIIDPIGSVPIFMALTAGMTPAERRITAMKGVMVALFTLMFFLVAGQALIETLGIGLHSFQIAGGIILFIMALAMVFGLLKSAPANADGEAPPVSVFPLGVPAIAGPGAMLAVVLLTDNNRYSIQEQAMTAGVVVAVLVVVLLFFLAAGPIQRVIGTGGAAIVSRVMGMILAALAVDNIIEAVIGLIAETAI